MLLFLVAAALTLAVAAALVRPLLRDRPRPDGVAPYNAAVYRDQLAELGRDGAPDARVEIERRLLASLKDREAEAAEPRPAPVRAAFVVAAAVVTGAGALYLALGSPLAGDHPFKRSPPPSAPSVAAAGVDGMHPGMEGVVSTLAARLEARPEDAAGWALLARSDMRLERPADAVRAYDRALALPAGRDDAGLQHERVEAAVAAAGGAVDDDLAARLRRRQAADPKDPQARYYLALAQAQHGDAAGAVGAWKALAADSPGDAPWLPMVRERIAAASGEPPAPAAPPDPDAAQIAAAARMSDADRGAMIEEMVASLAARLKAAPDDLEGWRRLARAQAVLGRPAESLAAWRQVRRLAPGDADAAAALASIR